MTRSQPPFGISTYAANLPREAVGSVVDAPDRRPEGTSSWSRFGDGLLDRYRSHQIDGKPRMFFKSGSGDDVLLSFLLYTLDLASITSSDTILYL